MMGELGPVIREIRTSRRMSQMDLGRMIGRKHHIVSRWESGERHPCITSLKRLIGKLSLTDDEVSRLLSAAFFGGRNANVKIVGRSLVVSTQSTDDDIAA